MRVIRITILATLCSTAAGLALSSQEPHEGAGNLCVDGRIAPQLVLYGPARASTSTFARNLVKSSGVIYGDCIETDQLAKIMKGRCPVIGLKEMHFFAHWEGDEQGKSNYLAHFPVCQIKKRIVAADLTPGQYAPGKIAQFYGQKAMHVTFVMLLRNPAKGMQSFYYYEKQDHSRPFKDYASSLLLTKKEEDGGRYLANIQYAKAIGYFFGVFDPSQLIVAPMSYNEGEKDGMPRLTDFLWDHFGLPAAPADDPEIDSWNRNDGHPSLEDDLEPSVLAELHKFLDEVTGSAKVAKVLADSFPPYPKAGPLLYGYKGAGINASGVDAWLANGW